MDALLNSFNSMDLKPVLLRGVCACGYAWPGDVGDGLTASPSSFASPSTI